jgi:hypothetical protein
LSKPKWKFYLLEGLPIIFAVGLVSLLMPYICDKSLSLLQVFISLPFMILAAAIQGVAMRKYYLSQFNKLQKKKQGQEKNSRP